MEVRGRGGNRGASVAPGKGPAGSLSVLFCFVLGGVVTSLVVFVMVASLGAAGAHEAIARPWELLSLSGLSRGGGWDAADVVVLPPRAAMPLHGGHSGTEAADGAAVSAGIAAAWSAIVGGDPGASPDGKAAADRQLPLPVMPALSQAEAVSLGRARLEAVVTMRLDAPAFAGSGAFVEAIDADKQAGLVPAHGKVALTTGRSPFQPLAATARRGSAWAAVGAGAGALPSPMRVGALYLLGHAERWAVAAAAGRGAAEGAAIGGGGLTPAGLASSWGLGHDAEDAVAETLVQVRRMRPRPEAAVPACAAHAPSRAPPTGILGDAAGRGAAGADALVRAAADAAAAASPDALYAECGFALWFPVDTPAAREAVLLAARLLGRPAVLRWSPDAWPGSAVTAVVPTSAAASAMAASASAARLPEGASASSPLGRPGLAAAPARGPGEFTDEMGHSVVSRRVEL